MNTRKIPKDTRDYLVNTAGITPVSVGQLNTVPINQYAVAGYPGLTSIKTHGATDGTERGNVLDEQLIQIQVRDSNAQTALDNTTAIVNILDGLSGVTINGTLYTYMQKISEPRILTKQEDGSIIYIVEFKVQARR